VDEEEEEEEAAMDSCSTGSSTGSNFRELDVEFLQVSFFFSHNAEYNAYDIYLVWICSLRLSL
jgi:hypothetical protein